MSKKLVSECSFCKNKTCEMGFLSLQPTMLQLPGLTQPPLIASGESTFNGQLSPSLLEKELRKGVFTDYQGQTLWF